MAYAQDVTFGTQYLLIGDGASPEVFGSPCGLTSLTRTTNKSATDTVLPDCDDADAPSKVKTRIASQQLRVSGSGSLDANYAPTWREWDKSGGERNCRWKQVGGHYEGPAVLVSYSESAEQGGSYTVEIEVAFNDDTWVAE